MKLFLFFMSFVSLSTFAGDSYLVCADLARDEEWVVDLYFDNTSSTLSATFEDLDEVNQKITVSFDPSSFNFSASVYNIQGDVITSVSTKLEWFEYQSITNRYACKVTD
jgi:uncharacterized SAM-dependent methyltransferase